MNGPKDVEAFVTANGATSKKTRKKRAPNTTRLEKNKALFTPAEELANARKALAELEVQQRQDFREALAELCAAHGFAIATNTAGAKLEIVAVSVPITIEDLPE